MSASVRVLVVDDSALMRKLIPQILSTDMSIEVVGTAMDGNFGLKKMEELRPQMVTLDLEMPGMNGIEICRRLRKESQTRNTPVVIVTAKASDNDIRISQELGVAGYITKPFSVRELIARVNSLLNR